jgi:hypothetical protein
MAITTISGAVTGSRSEIPYLKVSGAAAGTRLMTNFYGTGAPIAAVAPTPGIAGEALTTYLGQVPFTNPSGSALTYLARISSVSDGYINVLICDRLWHNSGIDVTSTGAQTINSATWPARDRSGSTNGEDVYIAVEVSTNLGAGTPTFTMVYTNSAGTGSQTITTEVMATNMGKASFVPIELAAGDTGVRSIQTWTQSATMTSGVYHLVAYRVLAILTCRFGAGTSAADALQLGFPRCYDNTVPFAVCLGSGYRAFSQLTFSQG